MPEPGPRAPGPFLLGALVLAAGGSSRMGAVKQLLEIDGRTLVARAVDGALEAGARPVVVVLGSNAEGVRAAVAGRAVLTVNNTEWASGLASSVRAGVAALLAAAPALDAVLVAPCDQPALSAEVVRRLVALHRETGRISAARFNGRNGAPAVFGRGHFAALGGLAGDEGARQLLNADPGRVAAADLPALGFDIDTPEDLAAWKARRA